MACPEPRGSKNRLALLLICICVLGACSNTKQQATYQDPVAQPFSFTSALSQTADLTPTFVVVSPPAAGHASDDWLKLGNSPWTDERQRRNGELIAYLQDNDPQRAGAYRFREGHSPALAWNWFDRHPIGYGGVPYVLLQTFYR